MHKVRKRELAAQLAVTQEALKERARETWAVVRDLERATARLAAIEEWMGSVRSTEGLERLVGRLESSFHGEQGVWKRLEMVEQRLADLDAPPKNRRKSVEKSPGKSRERAGIDDGAAYDVSREGVRRRSGLT